MALAKQAKIAAIDFVKSYLIKSEIPNLLIRLQHVNWVHQDDTNWKEEYMYIHIKEVFKKHRIAKEAKQMKK